MKIYKINDNKFKSIYITYNLTAEVKDLELYSRNAVLGALMSKSSKTYKNQKEIERYLNSLYGSYFDVNVEKLGDLYNFEFRIEFINSKFLPNNEDLSDDILKFLEDIIYNPAEWPTENIEREKEFILQRINERKDEKLKYGIARAEELMCKDEPYGEYLFGREEVVKNIDLETLKKAYKDLISQTVTVVVSGNLEGYEDIDKKIENRFSKYVSCNKNIDELSTNINAKKEFKYEEVKEYQDTTQSVISLGIRIENAKPEDYYALNIYNAILGTTPASKLFQNVREKASLAYTVRSRYYRTKEMIVIYAGINKENYLKAYELIKEQMDDMKSGNITDEEFISAKDSLLADLLEWNDSKMTLAKLKISNLVAFKNANITIEDLRRGISKVTFEDVVKVAQKIKIEKVFLLGGEIDE